VDPSITGRHPAGSSHTAALPVVLILLSLLTTSCADSRRVSVEVDSHGHEAIPLKGKRLWVDLNEKAANLFIEEEVATKIMHGLESRGYSQAIALNEADYRLEFMYELHNGQEALDSAVGHGAGPVMRQEVVSVSTASNTTVYKGRLILRLFSRTDATSPIWVGEAISSGRSSDLRQVIDYLIAAALNHLGQDIPHRVSYTFNETDTVFNRAKPVSIQPDNP